MNLDTHRIKPEKLSMSGDPVLEWGYETIMGLLILQHRAQPDEILEHWSNVCFPKTAGEQAVFAGC